MLSKGIGPRTTRNATRLVWLRDLHRPYLSSYYLPIFIPNERPHVKLLHLDSSILNENSATRAISAAVVERLKQNDPAIEVTYRDLAAAPLPHVTLPALAGDESAALVEELLSADILVIGVPMYNFGMPTQLKAWFDHVLVAGRTFRYTAEGPQGLAGDKHVFVCMGRGGFYSEGPMAAMEHAESHVKAMLGFIGITDPAIIAVEGVAISPKQREASLKAALDQVAELKLEKEAMTA